MTQQHPKYVHNRTDTGGSLPKAEGPAGNQIGNSSSSGMALKSYSVSGQKAPAGKNMKSNGGGQKSGVSKNMR